jgi:wyosine [tRNA(Phe)-imidazoG37] synthetase (radical SAM superfamily)
VTQLYVSVDASTKASLKKIDRPLFSDFWERFLDSLRALAEKVKISGEAWNFRKVIAQPKVITRQLLIN